MRKKLLIFLAVCFGLSFAAAGLFYWLKGHYSGLSGTLFATGYMLLPLVSVIITQAICGEKLLTGCNISFRFNRWWIMAWLGMSLFPIAATAVSVLMPGTTLTFESDLMRQSVDAMAAGGLKIGPWGVLGITLLSGLAAGATINAVFAFCEEIAWRGFLVRFMQRLGFWQKSLIIGAIWGLWHAPLILMGHNYPSHPASGVFMMIAFCILLSPVLMYFTERSGSVIVAAIAHGTMNALAGISLMLLSDYNELLCGVCGLAGMLVLLAANFVIYASHSRKIRILWILTILLSSCSVYTKPQKIDDYLYTVEYSKYDFEKLSQFADGLFYGKKKLPHAIQTSRTSHESHASACSAVRRDSLFGRNFDWYYDEMPEFVIRTSAAPSRYASIGVASPISVLKERQIKGLWGSIILDKLPLFTVDGINEKGVACCVNVAPQGDCGYTAGTSPGKEKLYAALLVRYILDNAASTEEAIRLVEGRNIYTSTAFGLREDYHFMIADREQTVVVEFVDNKPVILRNDYIMTNFNLAGGVTPHAMGLERYDILSEGIANATTEDEMFRLMQSVWFSGMYDPDRDPQWLSEICSENETYGLTTDDIRSAPEKFTGPMEEERNKYRHRSRKTSGTWHSVHTSIYNLNVGTLSISSQEGGKRHTFSILFDYRPGDRF